MDFEKAYDLVNWKFLEYMLSQFGFDERWRGWMPACVCSGSLLVLVNGCPTEEIQISRGLKQGDPLAPFPFLLVVCGAKQDDQAGLRDGYVSGFCGEGLWSCCFTYAIC